MRLITTPESRLQLSSALRLMAEALDILDALDAPGEIGSMVDLAASRLEQILGYDDPAATGTQRLISQLEREFAAASKPCRLSPWDITPL